MPRESPLLFGETDFSKGDADPAPIFRGLPDNRCQFPRWGYVVRGRVGFRLTDKGYAVHEAAQRLFARLSDFSAEVGALRGAMWGDLTIGIVDSTITRPAEASASA